MIESVDVTVIMHASQSMGAESENQDRTLAGKWYERGGAQVVKYRDSESDTVDTLEITGRRVRLRRTGAVSSEMEFAAGESHIFDMETSLGAFSFMVRTKRVAVGIYAGRLTVELAYELYADGSLVSHNHIDYEVISDK